MSHFYLCLHRQVSSLWSHTHIVKWALSGLTPTSLSGLFMVHKLKVFENTYTIPKKNNYPELR
jgi:hypothetical protein